MPLTSQYPTRRRFLLWLTALAALPAACSRTAPTEPRATTAPLSPTSQPPAPPPTPTSPSSVSLAASPSPPAATSTPALAVPSPSLTPATAPPVTIIPPPSASTAPPAVALSSPAATPTLQIAQPANPSLEAFARYAEEMRRLAVDRGDQPFGAIIVKGDQVVGLGPSRVVLHRDPTAHAEMEAIRDAARRLGTADLSGCIMVSTSRPCPMCESAAYWARLDRLFYGPTPTDAGRPRLGAC